MRTHLLNKETRKKGFTLVEMMIVVGIIAILCAIAIPSLVAVQKTLRFKQMNDYAESIFMAAQTNLTKMRSQGRLDELIALNGKPEANGAYKLKKGMSEFPIEDWNKDFRYTVSGKKAFDVLLPANSIDTTVRDQTILIEYDPVTGNVYSVFFSDEEGFNIRNAYTKAPGLPRNDERARKAMFLGYYQGSDIPNDKIDQHETHTVIRYENGEEGIVKVNVIIPGDYDHKNFRSVFLQGVEAKLIVHGENTPDFLGNPGVESRYEVPEAELVKKGIDIDPDYGNCISFEYSIDSLLTGKSFASHAAEDPTKLLTGIKDEKTEFKILPGDNVLLEAQVSFTPPKGYHPVDVKPGQLAGVSPLFEYLEPSTENPDEYVIGIKNGRNLQNLNIIAPSIAKKVKSIQFTEDKLFWSETVAYYNVQHANNSELPGRCLPYFVPIYQKDLFGAAVFEKNALRAPGAAAKANSKELPTIQGKLKDEADKNSVDGTKIYYLNIDAENHNTSAAKFYATEKTKINYAQYTGLFSYINTRVDNIKIVNPAIKGSNQSENKIQTAAGALFGAASEQARITNCAVYLEKCGLEDLKREYPNLKDKQIREMPEFKGYNSAFMTQVRYDRNVPQKWYGVSGYGAVGGLSGYCFSNDEIPLSTNFMPGNLDKHLDQMSFYKSFAAVPVSGKMHTALENGMSFWEGIGGFIGNSMQANTFACYASGNVWADGGAISKPLIWDPSEGELDDDEEFIDDDFNVIYNGELKYPDPSLLAGKTPEEQKKIQEQYEAVKKADKKDTKKDDGKWELEMEDWAENRKDLPGFEDFKEWMKTAGDDDLDDYWEDRFGYELKLGCDGQKSIGAGGFVGTSHGTRYSNCFATGSVTRYTGASAGEKKAKGGYRNYAEKACGLGTFAGVMCFDGLNDKCYGLFDSCYALGITANLVGAEPSYEKLFSGGTGLNGYMYETLFAPAIRNDRLPMFISDYYRLMAPYYKSTKKTPAEGALYFFKDSYQYWNQMDEIPVDSTSNECAVFTDYDTLCTLHVKHHDKAWREDRIENTIAEYNSGKYKDFFEKDSSDKLDKDSDLYKKYLEAFNTGFQAGFWNSADKDHTHPYRDDLIGQSYPFSKIFDLDYYGNWPSEPRDAGLAYYEIYNDGEKVEDKTRGIFYDRDGAAVGGLKNGLTVFKDGYAILSQSADKMSILKNGQYVDITPENPIEYRPGGSFNQATFHVFPIPEEYLAADDGKFYTKLTVKDNHGKTFTAYYNPNVALSQVNPSYAETEAKEPANLPDQILIRSARHFYEVSQMSGFWHNGCNYYQQLDINANEYAWEDFDISNPGPKSQPIGNAQNPFTGTYSSYAVDPAAVRGFCPDANVPDAGLFGVIGSNGDGQGRIENLVVKADLEVNAEIAGSAANLGYVAGRNDGVLDNVTLDLNTDGIEITYPKPDELDLSNYEEWDPEKKYHWRDQVQYNGKVYECTDDDGEKADDEDDNPSDDDDWKEITPEIPESKPQIDVHKIGEVTLQMKGEGNVGALAGQSSGLIRSCTVTTENFGAHKEDAVHLSLSGKNVGAMIGTAAGTKDAAVELIDSNVLLKDDLILAGDNCGGMVGVAENAKFDVANLRFGPLENTAGVQSASSFKSTGKLTGGFAAQISSSVADLITADLNCSVSCSDAFGGFAVNASDLNANEATVLLRGGVNAKTGAGLIVNAANVTLPRPEVNISGDFTAENQAAGMFGDLKGKSAVYDAVMELRSSELKSSKGWAAGFAGSAEGRLERINVFLVNDNAAGSKITGNTDTAGFVIHGNTAMSSCNVSGMGEITSVSGQAAGFACDLNGEASTVMCTVTPVLNDGNHVYGGNSLKNLKISGKTVASGFINTVNTSSAFKSTAGVYNSWALATIQAEKAVGFVDTNHGKIEKCMANIAFNDGYVFTANNEGKVTACYGWYTDGETPETNTKVWGEGNNPVSSYFGDIDARFIPDANDNNTAVNVTVYDFDGNAETASSTRIIFDKKVLEKLNKPGAAVTYWQERKHYDAYPFDLNLGTEYPYPMLRDHYGDWGKTPDHSFGIVYYEIYDTTPDGEASSPDNYVYWIHSRDIFNGKNGIEEKKLDYKSFFKMEPADPANPNKDRRIVQISDPGDMGKPILVKENGVDVVVDDINHLNLQKAPYNIRPDRDILTTGYAVFCKKSGGLVDVPVTPESLIVNAEYPNGNPDKNLEKVEVPNAAGDYGFYKLLKNGPITVNDRHHPNSEPLNFNTWFGDTIDTTKAPDHYEIRDAEHFQNLAKAPSSHFTQTWDILNQNNSNPEFVNIEHFSGTYDGNGRQVIVGESGDKGWIKYVDQNKGAWIKDVTLEVQNNVSHMIIESSSDTVSLNDLIIKGSVINNNAYAQPGSLFGATSAKFECKNIIVEGDLVGYLFDSVSGNGLVNLDSLTINGNIIDFVDPANPSIKAHSGILNQLSTQNPFTCKELNINGKLNSHLIGFSMVPSVSIEIPTINIKGGIGSDGCIRNDLGVNFGIDTITIDGDVDAALFNTVSHEFAMPDITINGNLNANLFGSVSNKINGNKADANSTHRNALIDIQNGTMKAGVFGSITGSVSNVDVKGNTAIIQTVQNKPIGLFANNLSAAGKIDQCSVAVDHADVYGKGKFALFVGKQNGTVNGCTSSGKVNLFKNKTAPAAFMSLTEEEPAVTAGFAAENTGDITNCSAENVIINIMGEANREYVAAGLVGINEGKLSGNTVKEASITYTQPAMSSDTAKIGGLVGQMNGGSMEGDNVDGSILIKKDDSNEAPSDAGIMTADITARDYSIGGAVGAESSDTLKEPETGITAAKQAAPADYMDVTSDVVIADEWTDPKYVTAEDLASAGMFVGYVEDGIFDSCTSTAEDNKKFGFLGDIKVESKTTPVDAFAQKASDAGSFLSLDAEENLEDTLTSVGKKNYDEYAAVLSNCTFRQNGQDFQQTIQTHEFFYQKKEAKANQPSSLTPVGAAISQKEDLLLKDLAAADTEGAFVPTFFYGTAEDGSLQRLAVLMMADGDVYTYELAFMDGTTYDVMEVSGAELETAVWNTLPVFTFTHNLTDGAKYLILDNQGQMLTVSQSGELNWEPEAESIEKIEERMLWIASRKNVDSVSWQNVSNQAYFLSDDLTALAGDHALEFQIGQDSSIRLGSCEKALKLMQVNMMTAQAEKGYESIGSSQTLLTQKLDENGDPIVETEAVTETTAAAETTEGNTEFSTETSAATRAAEAPEGTTAETTIETTTETTVETTANSAA